jgi:beta-galactosidase
MSIVSTWKRLFCGIFAAAIVLGPAAAAAGPRLRLDLAEGWHFKYGEEPTAVTSASFDDGGWPTVSLPHTWNRIGEYTTKRSLAADDKQGVGWYRLHIRAPAARPHERHYLQFDGVSIIADVWVNGVQVGTHKGAFSRFRLDVSRAWKPGSDNVIAVKADNSKPAIGSSTQDVLPLAGDFFVHGGIYRGVSLISANDIGIDLLDFGGPGIYVKTQSVTPKIYRVYGTGEHAGFCQSQRATLVIATKLRNSSSATRTVAVLTHVSGENELARMRPMVSRPVTLAPGAVMTVNTSVPIESASLWNGRAGRNMYNVAVSVSDGKSIIDSDTVAFGIRTFKFDANMGFSLNGNHVDLHGVSRHQDRAGKGYALSTADHAEDMALIKEMGANTIRGAHYQHAQEWYDLADKNGMVVWAELPFVTTPSHNGGDGSAALFANAEQQMRELIRQNYNHPSIMMWSIGNEVDAARGFGIGKEPAKPLKLLQHMQEIAKAEDPSRPTIFADCCEEQSMLATAGEPLAGTADMIGYNRYYGWYYPKPLQAQADFGAQLDHFHAKHPALPMSVSEYGAGGAVSQHSDDPTAVPISFVGRPQPEEYQSWVLEQNWAAIKTRKFVFASWIWNMFDFASDLREEGDSVDLNTKGLMTFDRKVKKDAFYFFQAHWTTAPMIHLNGRRYVDRAYPVIDVRGYSTAEHASLSLNGIALGEAPCPDHICVWSHVTLKPGKNELLASATADGSFVSDTIILNGPDPAKGVHIAAGTLAGHENEQGERYGSDTFFTGGSARALNGPSFGAVRLKVRKTVAGATDPVLYDYWREGSFSYDIPLADGAYTVTIHSFEPAAAQIATRSFSVQANGKVLLQHLNPGKEAGGELKAMTKTAQAAAIGGHLKLDFTSEGGPAVVAAIDVVPVQ